MRVWSRRITVIGSLVAVGLAWQLHAERRVLTEVRRAYDEARQALAEVRSELARVQGVRRGRLLPLEHILPRVRQIVSQAQAQGVPLTFTASRRTTLTLAALRLEAIPCQIAIQSAALLPVVETLAALEQTQMVTQRVTLRAHQGAIIDFHLVGTERSAGEGTLTTEGP
jgi:hypothetical protein